MRNSTITKLDRRVAKLEKLLGDIVEAYDDPRSVVRLRRLEPKIAKARTALGFAPVPPKFDD